jgi:two-component system, chemotaxis family, chemotaxis protein CheY
MAVDMAMPILIVDDYKTMSRIVATQLGQLGFTNVEAVEDGEAALDRLHAGPYGLVIADWNMEPMSGYALLLEVRANRDFAQTRFMMMTADSNADNVVAANAAGVNGFIVKPFATSTLKIKLEAVIGKF